MSTVQVNFVQVIADILSRSLQQNELPPVPRGELVRAGEELWHQIALRGLPRPLAPSEMGVPGELSKEELTAIMSPLRQAMEARASLAAPLQQLVKACFYPPFRKCRESYRERTADGLCRRQQLERARTRVSGSHCVDCPYWTALTPEQHAAALLNGWAGDDGEFTAHVAVFLPQDFRRLRSLLAMAAHQQSLKS